MALFEFLMILLSIIIGLGLAEILSGIGSVLRDDRPDQFSVAHAATVTAIGLALLQYFWEIWPLREIGSWTFPAMLLMLAPAVLLFIIARTLFPTENSETKLDDHYFARSRLIWSIAAATVVFASLFRPIAFGMPLFVVDNASSFPGLIVCIVLAVSRQRSVHNILVPLVAATILLDTIVISYLIS